MIECDLQLTADGHVVIFHDWTVERTSNGSGVVRELPLAALRGLDAGSWRDARFAGERVPTLDETLDLVLPRARAQPRAQEPRRARRRARARPGRRSRRWRRAPRSPG